MVIKVNLKIKGKSRPSTFYMSLENYKIGQSLPIEVSRHHIIPYNTLRDFYNNVVEEGDIKKLKEFFSALSNNLPRYYEASGIDNKEEILQVQVLINSIQEGLVIHDKEGDSHIDGLDGLHQVYAWLPGNLFIGPKRRSGDPEEKFEKNAYAVIGNEAFVEVEKIYNLMEFYNQNPKSQDYDFAGLNKLLVDLAEIPQPYELQENHWNEVGNGKYSINVLLLKGPIEYNLKIRKLHALPSFAKEEINRNQVKVSQHYIIPCIVLRDFYNAVVERNEFNRFEGFFSALKEKIPEYEKELKIVKKGETSKEISRVKELIEGIQGGSIVHDKDGQHPDELDTFFSFYMNLPGNLFFGPKYRSDSPKKNKLENNVEIIVGDRAVSDWMKKIYKLMNEYKKENLGEDFRDLNGLLIDLAQKTQPYKLREDQWIQGDDGKYTIKGAQLGTACQTRGKRAASRRMLCIDLNDIFRLSEEANRAIHTEEGKKTFQEILRHLNEGKHNLNESFPTIYDTLADKWQRLRSLGEEEEALYNFSDELASIWIRALQDKSVPFKNIDLSSVYNSLLKLRNFNDRWKIENPKLRNLILELANKVQVAEKLLPRSPKRNDWRIYTKFGPQDIANTLNALSKWDLPSSSNWESRYELMILDLVERGAKMSDQFNAQDIVSTFDALSKWDLSSSSNWKSYYGPLIFVLVERGMKISDQFNAQDIVSISNAMSERNLLLKCLWCRSLVFFLALEGMEMPDQFNAQGIASILNALSKQNLLLITKWGGRYKPLILGFLERAMKISDQFNAHDITNTLNVLSKWGLSSDPDLKKHRNLLIFKLKKRRDEYKEDEPELNIDDEMAVKLKELKSKIDNEVLARYEKTKGTITHDINKIDVLSNALQSIQLNIVLLSTSQENKTPIELERKTHYNALIDIGALVYDHKNHVHGDHLSVLEDRIRDNQLLSVAHDLYYLSKNENNEDNLYSDQIKNKISSYSDTESESRLDAIYSELSDIDIRGYFSDGNVKDFYTEAGAYNKEVMTIHSTEVSADGVEVYVSVKDNNDNHQKVVVGNAASIKSTKSYILDEKTSEIKFKTDNNKEYIITQEGEGVDHYLNTSDGYKVKVSDIISSFTENEKEVIHNELNKLELSAAVKWIKEISDAEITDQDYDNVVNEIKQSLLQQGISEGIFDQFKNHLDNLGEEVFEEYINDVEKKLEGHGIEFDRNKFGSARVKGAKGGKFFFFMAIYDLFDSVNDVSTLGRHGNDALKQIFGINGVLDALDDVRKSLNTQYMRSDGSKGVRLLGKITNKIPDVIRQVFVKIISNPVVEGITFATVAYQFGYSIAEIVKGNHHPLNYYWTTSSGVKLASMSIRPVMGVSFAMKGVSITPKILRGLSIAGKVLGKLSTVTSVVDMLISIGMSIHERVEYTRAIAEQVPLLPGKEQADVFFAKWIKFFTRRDVEEEYKEIIRIKGHFYYVKKKAIEVLVGSDVGAVVWPIHAIKERYSEIIIEGGAPLQRVGVGSKTRCEAEKQYKSVSFNSGAGTISNSDVACHDLSSLNISKPLEMKPYTLGMSGGVGAFRSNMGCFYKSNEKEVYIIDTNAKHVFDLTRFEYESLNLRVVDAPLKYTKKEFQCGAVINRLYSGIMSSTCNGGKVYRECTQEFVLSGEPFVFADIKKNRSSPILYRSGPNQLIAAKDYPAIMYVPKDAKKYIGSKNHYSTFIINDHVGSCRLEGGAGKENTMIIGVTAYQVIADLSRGLITLKESKSLESSRITLLHIYSYVSHSTAEQNIITNCKTRYVDAGKNGVYNIIRSHDVDCQDKDYEVRKVNEKDTHLRSTKQTTFIVDKSSGNGAGINSGNLGSKKNSDVILFEGDDIRLLKINEHQDYYNLEFLADDEKSTVKSVRIDDFEKLVIKVGEAGVVKVQNKPSFDLIRDMNYQRLGHSGIDVGSKIVAVVIANIIDSKGQMDYEVAKDIINNLGVPISLVQAKKIVGNVVYETIIGGIYTDEIAADFSCENIHCKKVITIEMNSYSSDYVVKFPQIKRSQSVDFTLRVITALYASTSDKVIDLTECGINPGNIKCEVNCKHANEIVLSSHINQGSFQIVLDNYLRGPKYQHVAFQFNKGGKFYKVNSANLKFEPAKAGVDPDGENNKISSSLSEQMFDAIDQDNMDKAEDLAKSIDIERLTSFDKGCASIEYQDIRGRSLLHLTAQEGKLSMVKFFINQGVSVMDIDQYDNTPFYYAAERGHASILDFLWNKANSSEAQRTTLENLRYKALITAAKNGHTSILDFLWNKTSLLKVQREMPETWRYKAFIIAAKSGHDEVLDFLWNKTNSSEVQRTMLETNSYEAFRLTGFNNHTDVLNFLWDKANSSEVQRAMLEANDYEAFRSAAKNDHVSVVDFLWDKANSSEVQRAMLEANDYEAFRSAAKNDHVSVVDFLWDKANSSEVQRAMLKVDDYEESRYEAFKIAAENGSGEVIDSLWTKVKQLHIQSAVLKINGYEIFRIAVENGHVKVVDSLWNKAESLKMHREMLKIWYYEPFKLAAENGHVKVVDSLWTKAKSLGIQSEMLKADDYKAFRLAAENDYTKIVNSLWEKAGSIDIRYAMLMARCYEAFEIAAYNGNDEVIDSLWTKAKSLGIQSAMLKANDYLAFKLAAKDDHTDIVNSLWERAELLGVQREMLEANNYKVFIIAAQNGYTNILYSLWNKAESLKIQLKMLKADNYHAFDLAAEKNHTGTLNFLWERAELLGVQREMLKTDDYEALAHIITSHNCAYFLARSRSVIDIDKESIIYSSYIRGISIQKWKECLEAVAHLENEEMLDWIWQNLISPLWPSVKQDISDFYQKLKQKFTEAEDSSKRAEESVQAEMAASSASQKSSYVGDNVHTLERSRRSIEDDNSAIESTSGTNKPSSLVNVFANTMVDIVTGVSRFISSPFKPAIGMESSKAITTQGADINGTLLLLDVFIRKITGQKYISTVDHSISPLEAQGYALNITNRFEKVLNETAIKSGISVTNLNFDPVTVQSAIVGQVISKNFSKISKSLYSFAKEACPEFKQTDKFLVHLRSQLEGEKETVLLQQKVGKPSKVLDQEVSRKVELSKKPDTFLNGTSVVRGISRAINIEETILPVTV